MSVNHQREQELQEQCKIEPCMKKISFTFPTYESMWQFRDRSKAINVSMVPKQHTITGLFSNEEVDVAINEFHAVTSSQNLQQFAKKAC
jgi:hypothetical protein